MSESEENELKIDLSKMSDGKAAAMVVAESARESKWTQPSFAGGLFMGKFQPELINPFPVQSDADKKIGDELCKKVKTFLSENLDPDEVDSSREIIQVKWALPLRKAEKIYFRMSEAKLSATAMTMLNNPIIIIFF